MIRVFRATPEDAASASQVLAALYHREPAAEERMGDILRDPGFVLFLAQTEDEYVAYLHAELIDRLDGNTMLLVYDITVAPEHRRKGIATKLMQASLSLGRDAGVTRCWLVTERDNSPARGLYEKLNGDQWSAIGFGWTID